MIVVDDHLALPAVIARLLEFDVVGPLVTTYTFHFRASPPRQRQRAFWVAVASDRRPRGGAPTRATATRQSAHRAGSSRKPGQSRRRCQYLPGESAPSRTHRSSPASPRIRARGRGPTQGEDGRLYSARWGSSSQRSLRSEAACKPRHETSSSWSEPVSEGELDPPQPCGHQPLKLGASGGPDNAGLPYVLADTADAVETLRREMDRCSSTS